MDCDTNLMPGQSHGADNRDLQQSTTASGVTSTAADAHASEPSSPTMGGAASENTAVAVPFDTRLLGIHNCEEHYRQGYTDEVNILELQLGRLRLSIQKLQDKLLDALDGDIRNPATTAHIHRELGLLLTIEKSVIERVHKVREKLRTSYHRQLHEQRVLCDSALAGGTSAADAGPAPTNSFNDRYVNPFSETNMQTHHNVNVSRIQVPGFSSTLKDVVQQMLETNGLIQKPRTKLDLSSPQPPDIVAPAVPPHHIAPSAPTAQPFSVKPTVNVKSHKKYHAFLTHNWGDAPVYATHERVKQICHSLKRMGLNLWFDEERMAGGNVIQDMTQGIDQSDVVVVFVTKAYLQKVAKPDYDNCKIEFMYAVNRMCSMMVAVPIDEDTLNPQSWSGPVGAILGTNLYPARFWDNGGEITPERSEFDVEVKKLFDRIASLCGNAPAAAVSSASSGEVTGNIPAVFSIPKKRSHPEFFIAQRLKFCYKVALHACASTSQQLSRLQNDQKFSRARMQSKFEKLYAQGIRVRDAFTTIIETHGACDVGALVQRLDELDTNFVRHVAQLAAPPHGASKFEDLFRAVSKLNSDGKPGRVATCEAVMFFHAFLLASPKYTSSDDFLVAYSRTVLKEDSLVELDKRGWSVSDVFSKVWNGERDIEQLFPNATSDGELRVVRLFEMSARMFCENSGLKPELGLSQISLGDVGPFFDLLVFIKTLGDLVDSQHSYTDLWDEINRMFDAQPPLRIFREVVGLVRRQNEWAANIPGPDANDLLKHRYSVKLIASAVQLQDARAELRAIDPAALQLWDRAMQHTPVPIADLTPLKLHAINLKRQLGGLVKIVLFLACKPPSAKNKDAHNKLVDDVLEVLRVVPINDFSGQQRTMSSFSHIVKHAIRDVIETYVTCAEIAKSKCPGDEVALLFAQELDVLIWDVHASPALLEELELQFKNFLKPVASIAVGRIGTADQMFEVDPVDSHTEQLLSRAAELCFKRYATTTSGRVCAGGPAQEKEKLIQQWSRVPDARKVLTALWSNPHDLEAACSGITNRRTIWFCKRIFSRCQKFAPLNSIEYFLEHNKVPMERIANLRDAMFYDLGRHRFCSGGPEMERQRVFDTLFPQLRDADCDIKDAVQALWSGERRSSVLRSMCCSELAREWMNGLLSFVSDRI